MAGLLAGLLEQRRAAAQQPARRARSGHQSAPRADPAASRAPASPRTRGSDTGPRPRRCWQRARVGHEKRRRCCYVIGSGPARRVRLTVVAGGREVGAIAGARRRVVDLHRLGCGGRPVRHGCHTAALLAVRLAAAPRAREDGCLLGAPRAGRGARALARGLRGLTTPSGRCPEPVARPFRERRSVAHLSRSDAAAARREEEEEVVRRAPSGHGHGGLCGGRKAMCRAHAPGALPAYCCCWCRAAAGQ
jgi:hypothetical protein